MAYCCRLFVMIIVLSSFARSQSQPVPSAELESRFHAELATGIGASMRMTRIASLADAERAANEFSDYVFDRTGHRISPIIVHSLADAEWRARATRRGSIRVDQFAETATRVFAEKLGGPGVQTPPTGGTTPWYVITPERLNAARLLYRRAIPEVVASDLTEDVKELSPTRSNTLSVQSAYPIEAFLALYTCVSEDLGRPEPVLRSERLARHKQASQVSPSIRNPYGDFGYFVKRPISKLFSEDLLRTMLVVAE